MFAVEWVEFNKKDQLVGKRKEFKTEDEMKKFIDKLEKKDSFYMISAWGKSE